MNTMQAEYRTDIARLAEDMAKRDAESAKDMARRDAESAKRDKENQRWTIGFGIAQIAITIAAIGGGIAILGLLIGLPS